MGASPGGAGTPSTATRRPDAPTSWLKTWWGRLVGLAAGIGIIAGAITAVVGLLPEDKPPPGPDPVDRATINGVQLTGPEPLSSFDPVLTIGDASATETTAGLLAPLSTTGSAPSSSEVPPTSSAPTTTGTTATGSPETGTTTATTDTTTGTTASTSSPTEGPILTDVPPIVGAPSRLLDQLYADIRRQEVLDIFALPELLPVPPAPPKPDELRSRAIPVLAVDLVDENGDPVAPQEAASRLAGRLASVRSTPTPEGEDPLGMRAVVDLEFEGLQEQAVLLHWRLVPAGDTPVPEPWAEFIVAAELVASAERDFGVATLWVPLPEEPGPYRAEVVLSSADGTAQFDSEFTQTFGD